MKRWQDRGEVQDSDDEDLSLGAESQSPEQARKRPRLNTDAETAVQTGHVGVGENDVGTAHDEETEEAWLQPTVATTYGRKVKAVEGLRRLVTSPKISQPPAEHRHTTDSPPCSQREQVEDDVLGGPRSSQSRDSEGLPGASQLMSGKAGGRDDGLQEQFDFSGLSSPLTERDVSPPPGFRLLNETTRAPALDIITRNETAIDDDDDFLIANALQADAIAAAGSRRQLRARKEKQLHPYLYDKTLYQQQWRQRGLKPVHYTVRDGQAPETQDQSYSEDESQSQGNVPNHSSSPVRASSQMGAEFLSRDSTLPRPNVQASQSEEEFPDIEAVLGRKVSGGFQDGRKRRKVFHFPRGRVTDAVADPLPSHHDQPLGDIFAVPPSPPLTSSDSAEQARPKPRPSGFTLPSGFRMPFGVALPTPVVSSDVRPSHRSDLNLHSDSESPLRNSRTPTVSRVQLRPQIVDSSTESEADNESEHRLQPEVEDRRIRKERKRIRGVLPASWLKIDLRAQQRIASPPPLRTRRSSSASPPQSTLLQKGVAQRVSRASATPARRNLIEITDEEDTDDASAAGLLPHVARRSQISPDGDGSYVFRGQTVDDDLMEVDWVDPMLAGSTRRAHKRNGGVRRQPRIKDVFDIVRKERQDFSGERAGLKHTGGYAETRPRSGVKHSRQPRRSRPQPPALGILDVPSPPTVANGALPHFVRLAQRQARRQPGRARHSPSQKIIRLATQHDTDEAAAILQAWREGTIAPRPTPPQYSDDEVEHGGNVPEAGDQQGSALSRAPLSNISNNRQQRLPPSLGKETTATASRQNRRIVIRTPSSQQTRLQPTAMNLAPGTHKQFSDTRTMPGEHAATALGPPRRPFRTYAQSARLRGAQLETLENAFDQDHRASAFERRIHCLTETVAARAHRSGSRALPLARFLNSDPDSVSILPPAEPDDEAVELHTRPPQSKARSALPTRPRKRQPQHVDAETRQYRQPSEPLPMSTTEEQREDDGQDTSGPTLQGLGPFGSKYAVDFDIQPLALGTYFHQSTFIGSGDFAASLRSHQRDLSTITGRMRVHINGDVLEWGAWTEEVAAGLARIPRAIAEAILTMGSAMEKSELDEHVTVVTSNVDHMLRSTVRYCSKCLAFLDQVDRRSCLHHLQRFVEDLLEVVSGQERDWGAYQGLRTRCLQYALVIARQAHQLSEHGLVQPEAIVRSQKQMSEAARKLASSLLPSRLGELRAFYEDNRHSSKRETGIRDDDGPISGIVTLHHCLDNITSGQTGFWSVVNEAFEVTTTSLGSVGAMDKVWYDIFTLLPTLEIDDAGVAQPGSRLRDTQQDWAGVKRLMDRLFHLYPSTSNVRGTTVNDYIRATFTRCSRLISRWGWWKCEVILGSIFDFFGRRGLAQLHLEESRGSPRFLEELANNPSLEVQPQDRSFHMFLKMLAAGLLGMQTQCTYNHKKIGAIAWRFMPNHGRTYRKDADVRRTDLDALRNHHDLLCTLYYASPRAHRLRLDLVRNLVDHSTSHREACRLSVRSWVNLASFQASTEEPIEALQPFVEWYREILQTTITQYRLAKTEAENDFAVAKAQGAIGINEDMLSATIASNQRQVAATLVDALAGLKRAIRAAKSLPAVTTLVEGCQFWTIFSPLDTSERRLLAPLDEALEVIKTALHVQRGLGLDRDSQPTSEDSQDYGDSSALQEFATTQNVGIGSQNKTIDLLYEPVGQLMSNVFGADDSIDDALLTKVVDVWVQLATESVRNGTRSWVSYLDDYSPNSWRQLRDTEQRRRFTPYFLACVTDTTGDDIEDVKKQILNLWLISLVEREAMLKYQHVLTAALLNKVNNEPLLDNPPYSKDNSNGTFNISLHDFRQRRLGLLAGVLSNMWEHFDETLHSSPQRLSELRRTYSDILKSVMQAMKSNYQELQAPTRALAADPHVQGGYVEFVQHVVSFLQQHTTDICLVDPFFTDSSAFPLPATDPTYVVSRLKAKVPKLAESKTRKQLAMFIHTVSERAAVDGQQQYLVDQLCSAMDGIHERGSTRAPSLRYVILTAIFPAYIESALSTACSWILALPILQACSQTARNMLYNIKLEDEASVNAVVETVEAVLGSLHRPLQLAMLYPGLLRLPHAQRVLSLVFDAGWSLLTLCDYLKRSTSQAETVVRSLSNLYTRAKEVLGHLESHEDIFDDTTHSGDSGSGLWADTRAFAQKQVQDALRLDWHAHDGQYFVRRGNSSKEVVVALGDEVEEQQHLCASTNKFCNSFEAITNGHGRRRAAAVSEGCAMDSVVV